MCIQGVSVEKDTCGAVSVYVRTCIVPVYRLVYPWQSHGYVIE